MIEIIAGLVAVIIGLLFRGNYHKGKRREAELKRDTVEKQLKSERQFSDVKEKHYEDVVHFNDERVDLGVYEHGDKVHHD